MSSRNAIYALAAAIISISHAPALADDSQMQTDRNTGCKLDTHFSPDVPKPRELEWSGACESGLAEGFGKVSYFSDGMLYWVDDIGPKSGLVMRSGKLETDLSKTVPEIKLEDCRGTSGKLIANVTVPVELNTNYLPVLIELVTRATREINRPEIRKIMHCPQTSREKEVHIYSQPDYRNDVAVFFHSPDNSAQEKYTFDIGDETWSWSLDGLSGLQSALKQKTEILDQVKELQRQTYSPMLYKPFPFQTVN